MLTLSCVFALVLTSPQSAALPASPSPGSDALQRADNANFLARGGHEAVLVYSVDPEFTESARKKHLAGDVMVAFIVDRNGRPKDIRVVKGVGLGLDEKAVEAVRQYRFKPATEADGQPVAMPLTIDVNFRTF